MVNARGKKFVVGIMSAISLVILLTISIISCRQSHHEKMNAAYYWSTEFGIDKQKADFISHYRIKRLYVRYFDVVRSEDGTCVPNATISFKSAVPSEIEVIPVVYIVNDCMKEGDKELAGRIFRRVMQMSETNDVNNVREIQIDCDWTRSTRNAYFSFLSELSRIAHNHNIILSSTIRLHQLAETPPPVDCGVLMMYNTGDFTKLSCRKPILDMKDAMPYLKGLGKYKLPLSAAYPIFGWKILFRDGRYVGILHSDDDLPVLPGDSIVERKPNINDILSARSAVEKKNESANDEIILFDLSNKNISRYKTSEYEEIYNR